MKFFKAVVAFYLLLQNLKIRKGHLRHSKTMAKAHSTTFDSCVLTVYRRNIPNWIRLRLSSLIGIVTVYSFVST
jgi:hypothetical protein